MNGNNSDDQPIRVNVPPERPTGPSGVQFVTAGGGVTPVVDDLRNEEDRLKALQRGEGIELSPQAIAKLIEARSLATTAVFRQLRSFRKDLAENGFFTGIPATLAPALRGELLNPDGTPAERIIVEALRPVFQDNEGVGDFSWPVQKAVTDPRGRFSVRLPSIRLPQNGLRLRLHGQNTTQTLNVLRIDAIDGDIGLTILERTLVPLQQSVVGELVDLFPVDSEDLGSMIWSGRPWSRPSKRPSTKARPMRPRCWMTATLRYYRRRFLTPWTQQTKF